MHVVVSSHLRLPPRASSGWRARSARPARLARPARRRSGRRSGGPSRCRQGWSSPTAEATLSVQTEGPEQRVHLAVVAWRSGEFAGTLAAGGGGGDGAGVVICIGRTEDTAGRRRGSEGRRPRAPGRVKIWSFAGLMATAAWQSSLSTLPRVAGPDVSPWAREEGGDVATSVSGRPQRVLAHVDPLEPIAKALDRRFTLVRPLAVLRRAADAATRPGQGRGVAALCAPRGYRDGVPPRRGVPWR